MAKQREDINRKKEKLALYNWEIIEVTVDLASFFSMISQNCTLYLTPGFYLLDQIRIPFTGEIHGSPR